LKLKKVTRVEENVLKQEMMVLRDRESGLRRRLMEHWAGVMAWEVRRLEFVVKSAEDRAMQAAQEVEELAGLRDVARQAEFLESKLDNAQQQLENGSKRIREYEEEARMLKIELNARDAKISDLEGALADLEEEVKMKRKEGAVLEAEIGQQRRRGDELEKMLNGMDTEAGSRVKELESELVHAKEERDRWAEEKVKLRESAEDGKMKANMWETAKISAAQALGVAQVENVIDISDGIKKLMNTVKDRDEELKVLKEEMREISLGFEDEMARLAKERDDFRAKVDEMGGRSLDEETVRVKQTEQLETKIKVSTSNETHSK
jgi:chromosome segregation ATPase